MNALGLRTLPDRHGDYYVGVLEQCITGTLPGDSARFVIARSFNTVPLDYPLIKLLSYFYTNASVVPSIYIFIVTVNMLPYENWHIKY